MKIQAVKRRIEESLRPEDVDEVPDNPKKRRVTFPGLLYFFQATKKWMGMNFAFHKQEMENGCQ